MTNHDGARARYRVAPMHSSAIPKSCSAKLLPFLLCLAAWFGVVPPAAAQPAAAEVYDDVKGIIEDLVESEVATSVVTQLGCRSPHGLLKYYPRTLQTVYERNLGALKDQLEEETKEFFANYLYETLRSHRSLDLSAFLPSADVRCDDQEDGCCTQLDKVGGPEHYARSLQEQFEKQNPAAFFKPMDQCQRVNEALAPEIAFYCRLTRSLTAAAAGDSTQAELQLRSGLAAFLTWQVVESLQPPPPGPGGKPLVGIDARQRASWTLLNEIVGALETLPGQATGDPRSKKGHCLRTLAQVPIEDVATWASSPQLLSKSGELDDALWTAAVGVALAKEPGKFKFELEIREKGGAGRPVKVELRSRANLETSAQADWVVELLQNAGVPARGRIDVNAAVVANDTMTVPIEVGAGDPVLVAGAGLPTLEGVIRAQQHQVEFERVTGLILTAVGIPDSGLKPADLRRAVKALLAASRLLSRVAETVERVVKSHDAHDVFEAFLELLRQATSPESCPGTQARDEDPASVEPVLNVNACVVSRQVLGVLDRGQILRPILAAALRKDLRGVAQAAVRALFSESARELVCCSRPSDCNEQLDRLRTFSVSLVSYVMMDRRDADAAQAAREAFRKSAYDLIRHLDKRGGFNRQGMPVLLGTTQVFEGVGAMRKSWKLDRWSLDPLIPILSLRASWNNAYENRASDGYRTLATVDWLIPIRVRFLSLPSAFVGMNLSLADPLAGFAEIASRDPDADYTREGLAFANMLAPRLSVLLGYPSLSKKLGVGVSSSLRTAIPVETASGTYGYKTWFSAVRESDGDKHLLRSLEVSLAVSYVP